MALPDLATQSTQLTQLAQLYKLQNILNAYVVKNILLVGQADQAQTETFINPNLYSVAVKYYGDYTYWTVIYNANENAIRSLTNSNYPDPQINATITLLIPPKPSSNTTAGVFKP